MNIQITAKKIEIPQDIRDYAKEKFSKLEKFNPNIQSIEAVIKAQERSILCEAKIILDKHDPIVVSIEGETIQAAVDLAEDKMERQLRKTKERASVRRRAKPEDREMP